MNGMRHIGRLMVAFFAAIALTGCGAGGAGKLSRHEFTRVCMGVPTRIVVYSPTRGAATAGAAAAYEEIGRLDAIMSDYRVDSELSRLCAGAGGPPVQVSADLFRALATAQELARETEGAFDVTAGPLVRLWREARRASTLPDAGALQRARASVGYDRMLLDADARTVRLAVPSMGLDLGGIGKGFAAQRAVEVLRGRGLARCLVGLAGDIVVAGPPPGARGWRIEVRHGQLGLGTLVVANEAVSTSGDAEQFVEIGGVRYSHVVDPRTGLGVTDGVAATVIVPRGEDADALATAACILGAREGGALLEAHGVDAIITAPGLFIHIGRDRVDRTPQGPNR